ncbi:UNVERIFIED_CONTAM: hypothetical protein Sindi_2478000 [Sesamum indicum]
MGMAFTTLYFVDYEMCFHFFLIIGFVRLPPWFFWEKKGLKQGDLMSLALFLLSMKYFSRFIKRKLSNPDFNFLSKCDKLKITHLLFADDLMLFFQGDLPSFHILMECLQEFRDISGLDVNTSKLCIFTSGVQNNELDGILARIEFARGEMPVRYLAFPLWHNSFQSPTTHRLSTRYPIAFQRERLSPFNLRANWNFLVAIVEKIHPLCKNFLRNSRRAPVAWEEICHPKEEGQTLCEYSGSTVSTLEVLQFGTGNRRRHMARWFNIKGLETSKVYGYFRWKLTRQPWKASIWKVFIPVEVLIHLVAWTMGRKNHARCASTLMNRPSTFSLSVPSVTMYGLVSAMAWHQPTYVTLLREVKWLKKEKTGSSV